ncbi:MULTISPECIES: hypothetical protein [Enterobacterales]|uniref:Uncharacterized protein n=1 Tax=Hafnia alvei TaxID=569 RepID=A0A1C6Z1A8_HAFAL|nr:MULTISPECIES: hypothetical protein [Enterobacterales]MDW5509678.1 hypothetical protein [Serratia proteamaculans]NLS55170.1 hypothetical protein [Hafnia alvei]SCM52940.1 hypothetical protein BN1044_02428 [Hafnia alvei]
MAGKNRMIVNFSSKKLRDLIVEIAEKNHMSYSKVIEKLVSFRLFESNGDPVIDAFCDASKTVMEQQQKDDGEFSVALRTPYIKHNVRLYKVFGDLSGKGSITVNHINNEKLNALDFEKELRKIIEDKINGMKPHEWEGVFDSARITFADLWLIFFNKINVEYKVERQESNSSEVSVKYKASDICCIPFSFNKHASLKEKYCNAMSHLDFSSVRYHSFKSVATKGWCRNKYSHLLFIHQSSSSDKGGFFIGVQYEKNDVVFSDESPRSPFVHPEGALMYTENGSTEDSYSLHRYAPYSDVNPELKISIYHEPANIKIQNLNPELKSKIK